VRFVGMQSGLATAAAATDAYLSIIQAFTGSMQEGIPSAEATWIQAAFMTQVIMRLKKDQPQIPEPVSAPVEVSQRLSFRPGWRVAVELETVRLRFSIFRLRQKSLARGTILALSSLWISFRLSGFPEVHTELWLIAPLLVACAATWDTARCLQKRWNFYHGGVILLIYVDLMVVLMISFLLLAPFSSVLL
jgi:hypothetical protein